MDNKLFATLSEIFKTEGDEFVELTSADLSKALTSYGYNKNHWMYQIDIDDLLSKNGFAKRNIFSQINIFWEHLFRCVITSEYSDNTGESYYRFFSTVEEYNKWVCVDLTGAR